MTRGLIVGMGAALFALWTAGCVYAPRTLDSADPRLAPDGFRARDLTPLADFRRLKDESPVLLARNGRAKESIVFEDTPEAQRAALFLSGVLKEMSGASFDLYRARVGQRLPAHGIFIGNFAEPLAAENPEAFRVRVANGCVRFTGHVLYAVYDWCERQLDVRWYGSFGRLVPRQSTLAVAAVDYSDRPIFAYRQPWIAGDAGWTAFQKSGGSYSCGLKVHAPHHWFDDPEVYTNHPAIFARPFGSPPRTAAEKPASPLLCYGNPETLAYYKSRIEAHLTGQKDSGGIVDTRTKTITVSPWDCAVTCDCEYCRAVMNPALGASGSASPVLWRDFTTRLAAWLKTAHPDYRIIALGYVNTCQVPSELDWTPLGNIDMMLCTMPGLALLKDPEIRVREEKLICDWHRATGRPVVNWHYGCWPADYTSAPYVYGHTIAAHYRRMRRHLVGSFICGSGGERFTLSMLVWMKCLWNPNVDVEGIYDEFARRLFGAGARPMRRLIRLQESGWNRRWPNERLSDANIFARSYPRRDVLRMKYELADALAATEGDPLSHAHVQQYAALFDSFFAEAEAWASGVRAEPLVVMKAAGEILIDGRLNEPDWIARPPRFLCAADDPTRAPEWATSVRLLWTPTGVVVGIRAEGPPPAKVSGDNLDSGEWLDFVCDVSGDDTGSRLYLRVDGEGNYQAFHDGEAWHPEGLRVALNQTELAREIEIFLPYADLAKVSKIAAPTTSANGIRWHGNLTRTRPGDWSRLSIRPTANNQNRNVFVEFSFRE